MSEEAKKTERTIEDVQNDFSQLCVKAGHVQYQIVTLKKELELLNGTIRDLNFEAAKINAANKEKEETK